jgi:hypothetical protein
VHEAHEAVPRVLGLQAAAGGGRDLADAGLEQRVDERVLVGEAPVDGADADAGVRGDLVSSSGRTVAANGGHISESVLP